MSRLTGVNGQGWLDGQLTTERIAVHADLESVGQGLWVWGGNSPLDSDIIRAFLRDVFLEKMAGCRALTRGW